jgi:hypothetical protein
MMYKYINDTVVAKIDDDGISRMSCSIENDEFKAWLSEGNTPEPADPIPEPVELTPEEKLANAGLSIKELKKLLGIK